MSMAPSRLHNGWNKQNGFAEAATNRRDSWADRSNQADSERAIMVAEFRAWIIKARHENQQKIVIGKAMIARSEFQARAAYDNSPSPSRVPMCVFEFLELVLELYELERKLVLIDLYYEGTAHEGFGEGERFLPVTKGHAPEYAALWDMFMQDHGKTLIEEQDAAKKPRPRRKAAAYQGGQP